MLFLLALLPYLQHPLRQLFLLLLSRPLLLLLASLDLLVAYLLAQQLRLGWRLGHYSRVLDELERLEYLLLDDRRRPLGEERWLRELPSSRYEDIPKLE